MQDSSEYIKKLEAEVAQLRVISRLMGKYAYSMSMAPGEKWHLEWSRGDWRQITGYTAEEFVARGGFPSLTLPEDEGLMEDHFSLLMAGQVSSVEVRIRTKQGEMRWLRVSSSAWTEPASDQVAGIIGVAEDVTDRRDAESALSRSENSFRLLMEHSPDGIIITDSEGLILHLNPAAEHMYGYSKHELIGQPSRKLNAATKDKLDAGSASSSNGVVVVEMTQQRKGDATFSATIRQFSVLDEAGDPAISVAFVRDTTYSRQMELQLRQAQKMDAVGRLAGGVAHDFNNLLTSISGNVAMTREELDKAAPQQELLIEVEAATVRATELTRQLLAFSRKQVITLQTVDLNQVLEGMSRMLQRVIGENITLVSKLGGEAGHLLADAGQLEQVILNLAVNARDAMPDGGVLRLETSQVELTKETTDLHPASIGPGPYMLLKVSDSGAGISPKDLGNVFEPFFTTKPRGAGTGLGLAMAYGILQQHNGFIEVESELGRGASFMVYMPRIDAPLAPKRRKPISVIIPRGRETVLVVEDEPLVRKMGVKILSRLGYSVLEAGSGEEALALVEQHEGRISLLFTDVVMPGINGRQLADKLSVIRPEIKVLYASGYSEDVIATHGVLDEGIAFLGKPYSPQSLAKKVREVLEG